MTQIAVRAVMVLSFKNFLFNESLRENSGTGPEQGELLEGIHTLAR